MSETLLQYLISALLLTASFSYPYRSYSSRSVPGRIRANSVPESLLDYIANYNADYYRNQQSQYGIPEYEPSYQQRYLSRRAHISPEAVAALLSYLSHNNANDYAYDLSNSPSSYTDDEGTWYDDSASSSLGYANDFDNFDNFDRGNQDAAIIQLYLDHLNGKYSLEDLETLEREAAMEDNTENQLRAYRTQKKSRLAPIMRKIPAFSERQGQKEEAYMVPVTSIRKPAEQQKSPEENERDTKHEEHSATPTVTSSTSTVENEKVSSGSKREESDSDAETTTQSTTMEPFVKSAYDALKRYLNNERRVRQNADEAEHTHQKRFISEPASLTEQLASLKKTVT